MSEGALAGLIVDWGGVLTTAIEDWTRAFCAAEGIDYARFDRVLREWLDEPTTAPAHPLHLLEVGQLPLLDVELALAARLAADGAPVNGAGLLERMFDHVEHDHGMLGLLERAHKAGIRTAVLSNSWGNSYPLALWEGIVDVAVISGDVGMRKPDPRIYEHTAGLLGLAPERCVFVDDLAANVRGAVAVGMVGVLHTSADSTTVELEVLFERTLAAVE